MPRRGCSICQHGSTSCCRCGIETALTHLQAQARQLAAERENLGEEQRQLAADVCRIEAHVQNHQLVTEARVRRQAADAAKVQQLEVYFRAIPDM